MENGTLYMAAPLESLVSRQLLEYAVGLHQSAWTRYYNFDATPVPSDLLHQDPFIVELAKKRKFYAGILRMAPDTCYNWHVDTKRQVGLNMLLADDNQSRCLFVDGEGLEEVFKTKELKYEPNTYYAFNTQKPHMVLNTTRPRYLFSLEFSYEDSGLTFDELCTDIKGMNHGY